MSDKLVFDLAQEVEGTPNVFVRKDWINILDNQNQNYNNNQSVIDTSQLSNSNKYMSYRESYFSIPFVLTLGSQSATRVGASAQQYFEPATALKSVDYAIGLKNWFGQIIHSFTLDYNGTTIIQQTPYVNMWNSFKLVTSLSMSDVRTQGATIGFYPDDPVSWLFNPSSTDTSSGTGTCNNTNFIAPTIVSGSFNNFRSGLGNEGLLKRQQYINFDGDAGTGYFDEGATYAYLLYGNNAYAATACQAVWKSYIYNKVNQTGNTAGTQGMFQIAIMATVYLKHIHSFFNMCPLLKGVFMKMTMNLNNTTTAISCGSTVAAAAGGVGGATLLYPTFMTCSSVSNPLGGVNPLMIASGASDPVLIEYPGNTFINRSTNGGIGLFPQTVTTNALLTAGDTQIITYRCNISVGAKCLDSVLAGGNGYSDANLAKSIYLYIPAYTFNPVFEQAYLSSPVKQIKYTDIYQYQVINVGQNANFNNLLTNGIANIKSVLILPFYSTNGASAATARQGVSNNDNTGFLAGTPVFQSPFDPAGTGPTSPMCWISNFNIQISGQNAIYNMERYNFEQWNNQLYGQNAVNGGLTDGLTSGLIDRVGFDMEYSYYYVNVERMLPVEQSVPKSVQILGQNFTSRFLDLYCFIEYGVDISVDALTGARV